MIITDEIVNHIAHLSRLEFKGSDQEAIKNDMEKIIGFMAKLSEVPTENVEPLIFMSTEVNRLREDVPVVSVTHEEALKNAIISFVQNPNKFSSAQIRDYAMKHFSYSEVGKRFTEIYTEVLK